MTNIKKILCDEAALKSIHFQFNKNISEEHIRTMVNYDNRFY